MIDVKEVGPARFELRMRCGTGPRKRYVLERPSKREALIWAARMGTIRDLFVQAGSPEGAAVALQMLAEQRTEVGFEQVEARSRKMAARASKESPLPVREAALARTFDDMVRLLLAGELQRRWPQHIRALRPSTVLTYTSKLDAICKIDVPHGGRRVPFGSIPLAEIGRDQADAVLASMTERGQSSGLQAGRILHRVMRLAVEPCRLIERFPFEKGWLPMQPTRPAFSYLFPAEEKLLMQCPLLPLEERLYFGFLAREGMRSEEAASLRWGHLDLLSGDVRLDFNKTDAPRTWMLGEDVAEALRHWRELCEKTSRPVGPQDLVFVLRHEAKDRSDRLRQALRLAGVTRSVLFERNARRRPLRLHDLRGTFVTLAMALGRTEDWITARTGHTTSLQLARYRRAAEHSSEHHLGWLCPLSVAFGAVASDARVGQEVGQTASGESQVVEIIDVNANSDKTHGPATHVPAQANSQSSKSLACWTRALAHPVAGGAGQLAAGIGGLDPALFDALLARARDGGFEALADLLH